VSKGIILPIPTQETIFAKNSVTSDSNFVWLLTDYIFWWKKLIWKRQCRFKCTALYNCRI